MVSARARRLAALLLVVSGLILAPGVTAPANATEILQDGGFEASSPSGDSPGWVETDSLFGTPLCAGSCVGIGPRTGTKWAWFGGSASGSFGSLSQTLDIPLGTASLTFWMRIHTVSSPFTATMTVKVDGATVHTYIEPATAEDAYTQRTVDLSAFADGGSHTLKLDYVNPTDGYANFNVDDVSLDSVPAPDTTAPQTTITSSPAGHVARALTVPIEFSSSESPSTFSCTVDGGAAAACASPKSLTVTPGQHTFTVAATDAALNADATPAAVTFTAYDCATLDAAAAAARAKSASADTKVAKAKKQLKKAKESDDATKIKKAKRKVKAAKKAAKKAKAALATATTADAPCVAPAPVKPAVNDADRR
jgi:hypothetical protein